MIINSSNNLSKLWVIKKMLNMEKPMITNQII